jgi:hypothetical protein
MSKYGWAFSKTMKTSIPVVELNEAESKRQIRMLEEYHTKKELRSFQNNPPLINFGELLNRAFKNKSA